MKRVKNLFYIFRAITYIIFFYSANYLEKVFNLNRFSLYPYNFFGLLLIVITEIIAYKSVRVFWLSGKGSPIPTVPPSKLVIAGPYKYTRNPLYVSVFSSL